MKTNSLIISLISILLFSCSDIKQSAKETLNKGGEVVGKTTTEFIEGVSEGVEKTLQCDISLSDSLGIRGISTGTHSINNGEDGGENNKLTLYVIFNKDFNSELIAKAFGKDGLEIGRAKTKVKGTRGDAIYVDFVFDKRTYIEVKSKITIE